MSRVESRTVGGGVTPSESAAVESVLARSRSLGFLGPGSLRVQVEHALGFAAGPVGAAGVAPRRVLDLGSGGGVPGLVLAPAWPDTEVVLMDAVARRAAFLESAVATLGLGVRVRVVRARAEAAGRDAALRGHFDVVVARGFGPPAVTAECAAPFLVLGGEVAGQRPPCGQRMPTRSTRREQGGVHAREPRPLAGVGARSAGPCARERMGRALPLSITRAHQSVPRPVPPSGRRARQATAVLTPGRWWQAGARPVVPAGRVVPRGTSTGVAGPRVPT